MPFRESQEASVHRNVVAIAAAPENNLAKKRWELQLVAAKAAQRILAEVRVHYDLDKLCE